MLKKIASQFDFRGFPREIWVVAAMQMVSGTGFALAFSFWSLYLFQERGLPMTVVGVIQLIIGLASGLFQIVGGILGDRFGHRRVALSFSVASVFAAAALAAAVFLKSPLWVVIACAAFRSIMGSGNNAPMSALIAGYSPKHRMTESYSLLAMTNNISWAIGPLLGGVLLGFTSFGWVFGIGVVLLGVGLIGYRFLPADSRTVEAKTSNSFKLSELVPAPGFILFALGVLLFFLTLSQWGGTLSVFTIKRIGFTSAKYGLLMSISSIIIIVFQYPVSHWMAGRLRMSLVLGCLFYAFGFLSLTWVRAFGPALVFVVIAVIGEMMFTPTAISVVGLISNDDERGKNMGIYGLCASLGISSGPLLGGVLLDRFPSTPLLLWGPISLCSFIAAIGLGLWRGYPRGVEKEAAERLKNE